MFQLDLRNLQGRGERRELLEKKLINSIMDFWNKNIIKNVKEITSTVDMPFKTAALSDKINRELLGRMEKHVKNIIHLGLLGETSSRVSKEVIDTVYQEFLETSRLRESIYKLSQRLTNNIMMFPTVSSVLTAEQQQAVLPAVLKAVAKKEINKFKGVIRSEGQYAIHLGREADWKARDPDNRYRYRWGIGHDPRTTECCKEIDRIAKLESKQNKERGVTLSRLKQIIYEQGTKYFPTYIQRPYNPHWNCRSGVERVI